MDSLDPSSTIVEARGGKGRHIGMLRRPILEEQCWTRYSRPELGPLQMASGNAAFHSVLHTDTPKFGITLPDSC